jgi:hypothetical protein
MLLLECFPQNNARMCKECLLQRPTQEASTAEVEAEADLGLLQPRQSLYTQLHYYSALSRDAQVAESSNSHHRRNKHASLSSSVAQFSDAGGYPSGGSTYGVLNNRKRQYRTQLPASQTLYQQRPATVPPPIAEVGTQLSELEDSRVWLNAADTEQVAYLQQKVAMAKAQHNNIMTHTLSRLHLNNTTLLEYYIPSYLNKSTRRQLSQICELWQVKDIADVFPVDIWQRMTVRYGMEQWSLCF